MRRRSLIAYGVAVGFAGLAVGLARALQPLTGPNFFGITVAAVAAVALLAGTGPAVVAACVALAGHLVVVHPSRPEGLWQLGFALVAAAGVIALGWLVRRARRREQESRDELERSWLRERQSLHALQTGLLPPALPVVHGLDVAARYVPAGEGVLLGGDFLDVIPGRSGVFAVLGDVCGKGPEAGAVGALARHTSRALAALPPGEVLGRINLHVRQQEVETRFVTAVAARLSGAGPAVAAEIAVAGHPPPLVVRRNGRVEEVACRGTLLGPFPEPRIGVTRVVLGPGDALVLYSDGIIESRSPGGPLLGDGPVRQACSHAAAGDAGGLVDAIHRVVAAHLDGAPASDDTAVLVLRAVP